MAKAKTKTKLKAKAKTKAKSKTRAKKKPVKKAVKKVRKKTQRKDEFLVASNPATLEEIGRVKKTDFSKMPDIFRNARIAQKEWADRSFNERKKHLLKMRDYIIDNAESLALDVSRDNGKSRIDALATEVIPCALAADWYAKNTKKVMKPRKLPRSSIIFFNKKNILIRVPLGVVAIISPWNYPLSIPFGEVVMGLMAGNAILLKCATATTFVGVLIENIVNAGELPPGLFHYIVGSGRAFSEALFQNGVNKIFFTGSVPTGKVLMKNAGEHLTPLSLELGGKDPMIVLPDADLERAVNGALWAGFQNAGQSCGGVERIYVHEAVYDKFLNIIARKTSAMRHGPDLDYEVEMGAMTVLEQLKIVQAHIKKAVKAGAKIAAQSSPVGPQKGYFHPATLMTDVDHTMDVMTEETFGPVLPIMKFKTIEEAITLANDSTMALTSSVWTKNIKLGKIIGAKLDAGVTTINDHLYTHGQPETPWGGWKESGLGRTHSALGIEEMTHAKLINWDILPSKRNIWWFPFDKKTYKGLIAAMYVVFPRSIFNFLKNAFKLVPFLLKKMFSPWDV
jgi:succinate-semialdehyde dehydrogenase/glutarate-semialdehyde dehydrogenase